MSLCDWTWRNGGRGKVLQVVYMFPWSEWPVGSQEVPAGVGGWDEMKTSSFQRELVLGIRH